MARLALLALWWYMSYMLILILSYIIFGLALLSHCVVVDIFIKKMVLFFINLNINK